LATLFGLFRAGDFIGTDVVAKGWYRRLPGPGIELREVVDVGRAGHRARSWTWMARYGGAILLIGIGVLVTLYGLGR
jgi:hypothetical protein